MKICIACGRTDVYFAGHKRLDGSVYRHIRCTECQWKRRKNGKDKLITRPKMPRFGRNTRVHVLKCPHNEYDKGSHFMVGDFKETLRGGNWTLGMVVSIEDKKYAVCGNGVVMKTMKKLNYPLGVKLQPQWLAEV